MNRNTVAAIGCMCALLAACGGGDDSGPAVTTPTTTTGGVAAVPSSAFQSVDSLIAYVRQLVADDTAEPLALPDVAAPTTDTAEPSA